MIQVNLITETGQYYDPEQKKMVTVTYEKPESWPTALQMTDIKYSKTNKQTNKVKFYNKNDPDN